MKYQEGLVSVVIPTYKRSEKLLRAIDSVLAQSYENIELLLVNDNDPEDDFTKTLLEKTEKYKEDSRFRLIMQEKHVNGAVARNIGIKASKGQYVAFLDDDDWWEYNKIEEQVKLISQLDDTWGGVSCKYRRFDSNGTVIAKSRMHKPGYIYKDVLFLLPGVTTGTLLLKHELLDTTRYFDENLLRHQDLQLLVDFTSKYKLMEVDQFLHCVDVSDPQNRPDPQNLIKRKKAFFESISDVMNSLSKTDRNAVYAMHKFELGYVCIKHGDRKKGLYYMLSVFKSPKAIFLAIEKIADKVLQKIYSHG